MSNVEHYWSRPIEEVLAGLQADPGGLEGAQVPARLRRFGLNTMSEAAVIPPWSSLLLRKFASPLVAILIISALISLVLQAWLDAWIVLGIVLLSGVLGFIQEYRAMGAVDALRRRVTIAAQVLRDGRLQAIPAQQIVPGDIVELSAGALVPADGRILEANSLHIVQAMLTGETLPVEKQAAPCPGDAGLAERSNCAFLGTSVRSGWGRMLVVDTGRATVYGGIAHRLRLRPPDTEFERGLHRFGSMLVGLMMIVVLTVLAINIVLHRPTIDTLLFAAALAVGLSPELLPAILTITLAHGAKEMARHGVIVKRLSAIENLGSMDVLCTDKTGTLTRGVLELDAALDPEGHPSADVLRYAWINAKLQAGIPNPLDDALIARGEREGLASTLPSKAGEIPYDFLRRRLSVIMREDETAGATLLTKGAVENVFEACSKVEVQGGERPFDDEMRALLMQRFVHWSEAGYRVLAVARKPVQGSGPYLREHERDMTLAGFLLFFDPPEPTVAQTLAALHGLGVQVKIITGDNRYVTRHVAEAVGLSVADTITGAELRETRDEALWQRASSITLFSEIDPNQKERIIIALRRAGHVVGYLGDGINDAPALHAADVGISVDGAVDVAKEAADFVLLEHDLDVLRLGINEGRRTFANTLKYIYITTSANFGNMISMAMASFFLPFLPLLAKQVLLNNFLSDIPAMGIAGDKVDEEWMERPRRWDLRTIRRSMLVFGLTSTIFDLLTFAVLLYLAGEMVEIFRTGWFVESLLTELAVLFVIRTSRPFHRSRPGAFLCWSVPVVMLVALLLPYMEWAGLFGFVALPWPILGAVVAITVLYALASEAAKRWFYRRSMADFHDTG